MANPTFPAVTFRSMRAALPVAPTRTPEEEAALRGANPAAGVIPGSFQEQNMRANAGIYDAGTFGAENAVANGTGVVLPARYTSRPAADPAAAPVLPSAAPNPEAMLMSSLLPSSGRPPEIPGADPGTVALAGAAAGLEEAEAGFTAERAMSRLTAAGMSPRIPGESHVGRSARLYKESEQRRLSAVPPEMAANNFGYLRSRLETSLNGGTPRAPGSPVYTGDLKLPGQAKPATGVKAGEAATLYRNAQVTSAQPRLVDFGGGVRGLVDRQGNVSRIPNEEPATRELAVGGRKLTVGPGGKYFDEKGAPVDFGSNTPPRAPEPFLKTIDPELYQAQREEYLAHLAAKKQGGSAAPAAAQPAGGAKSPALAAQDQQALTWAKANPKDPRAAKILARLGTK
jgi:hypothetical protein